MRLLQLTLSEHQPERDLQQQTQNVGGAQERAGSFTRGYSTFPSTLPLTGSHSLTSQSFFLVTKLHQSLAVLHAALGEPAWASLGSSAVLGWMDAWY